MKHLLIFIAVFCYYSTFSQTDTIPSVNLTVVQGSDSVKITNAFNSISLKAAPFKLVFHTFNSDFIYLNSSLDSTNYSLVKNQMSDSLECFHEYNIFFGIGDNNYWKDLKIDNRYPGGSDYLVGIHEDEKMIGFDSLIVHDRDEWLGVKTIESLTVTPKLGWDYLQYLKGKTLYMVYSPGLEKFGKIARLSFY